MLKIGPNPGSCREAFVASTPAPRVALCDEDTRRYGSLAAALIAAPVVEPTVVEPTELATAGGRSGVVSGAIRLGRVTTATNANSPAISTSQAVCGLRVLVPRISILALMVPSFTLAAGPAALDAP
jgi:hypothetical protein